MCRCAEEFVMLVYESMHAVTQTVYRYTMFEQWPILHSYKAVECCYFLPTLTLTTYIMHTICTQLTRKEGISCK